ncbi:MAG TPA: DUF4159 domain-containing protein, partial [Kiloniellales bacterium]|nr:DUF4159 domain-containing protein [Kiloniellales bacterium]
MLNLGALAFAQPWLLLALAGLPLLWLLLRVTPPAPRIQRFPAIRLLFGLKPPEETAAHTPLWLILLRMTIAALVILGLAQPLLNPSARLEGSGPLVLVIDDGWTAARHWEDRLTTAAGLIDRAERDSRPVVVATTAPDALGEPPRATDLLTASEARDVLQGLAPKPWPVDHRATLEGIAGLSLPGSAHVVWLSDGLDHGVTPELAEELLHLGRLELLTDAAGGQARLLLPPDKDGTGLSVRLRRAEGVGEEEATVVASAEDGTLVARVPVTFAEGVTEAGGQVDLPIELRNRIARLTIAGESSAGAVLLLDERWRRRPVGLVSTSPLEEAQPLLSELYYLDRALQPFTELRRGAVTELLQRELAVLVLPDTGVIDEASRSSMRDWIERGGLLLRFAGPRLAETRATQTGEPDDPLMPVTLRGGDRSLGGALTWDTPARLASFDRTSPFESLAVPDDVLIRRQVLAEPSLELGDKTWARLTDGTPLVTAERRGEGWVVLVHTTANTDWTNLPLSGLFPQMLRRVVSLSQGVATGESGEGTLAPIEILNGFGVLGDPAPTALAAEAAVLAEGRVGPRHPPGYYGASGLRRAHNIATADPSLVPISDLAAAVERGTYATERETDLKPWLLAAALILALADLVIALALRGLLAAPARAGAAVLLLGVVVPALGLPGAPADAQGTKTDDARALEATLQTHFAFVVTGVPEVDEISRAGLEGLSRVLLQRTSVEAGRPLGVNLARDELAFFPLLYWPITSGQRDLTDAAVSNVNDFMKNGGTILIDLREQTTGTTLFG